MRYDVKGPHVSTVNPFCYVYLKGDESTDGSIRASCDSTETKWRFEYRDSGSWVLAGIEIGDINDFTAQVISVAKSGRPFTSIKDACDSITDSSISKRYVVEVYPGDYTENPFVIPQYTTVRGVDRHTIRVFPSDDNSNLVTFSSNSDITGVTINGPSSAAALRVNNTSGTIVERCDIIGGLYGLHVSGSSGRVTVTSADFSNITRSLFAESSSRITVLSMRATLGAYSAYADDATIDMRDAILALNTSSSCFATNNGRITANMASIILSSYGVRVGANSEFDASNLRFSLITNDELSQDADTASIKITGGKYDSTKRTITEWGNVELDGFDVFPGNKGYEIANELHVGVPELGRESAVGEGDSYTRGMLVYTYNGTAYTDVSEDAASSSGSTFTFPNTSADTAIYVSSSLENGDKIQHLGIRQNISTAVVLGAGEIVAEYYNGSWTEFSTMTSEALPDYIPLDGNLFSTTGNVHTRYNCKIDNDWAKNDPMSLGVTYFWVRFRIKTSITTAPVFEQWRLHSNHTEMNPDGWIEYFGTARPIGRLGWDMSTFAPVSGVNPADQNLFLSDNVGVGRTQNKFIDNNIRRSAFNAYLPFDYDTGCPLRLVASVITDDATAGNIVWNLRWGYTTDGDNVYQSAAAAPAAGPNEQLQTETVAAPTASETQETYVFELDTSALVSRRSADPNFGDILWVSIEREGNAAGDTHSGDVSLIQLAANYTKWCEGGHA